MIAKMLGWEPSILLRTGLEKTYAWIFDQVAALAAMLRSRLAPRRLNPRLRAGRRTRATPLPSS